MHHQSQTFPFARLRTQIPPYSMSISDKWMNALVHLTKPALALRRFSWRLGWGNRSKWHASQHLVARDEEVLDARFIFSSRDFFECTNSPRTVRRHDQTLPGIHCAKNENEVPMDDRLIEILQCEDMLVCHWYGEMEDGTGMHKGEGLR